MPTVENFRAALNDVAADTLPLASAQVLLAGRRLRLRRRVLAGCGTALAVAGIATGAGLLAAPSAPAPEPLAQASSPAATSPGSTPVMEDAAALLEGLENGAVADGKGRILGLGRKRDTTELPPADARATTRTIRGIEVQMTPGMNWTRYDWISPGKVHWAVVADLPLDDDVLGSAIGKLNSKD